MGYFSTTFFFIGANVFPSNQSILTALLCNLPYTFVAQLWKTVRYIIIERLPDFGSNSP